MKKLITFISRAAMTLLTLVMAFTTQTAKANYDWYDTSITIGGLTANFSEWSRGNGAPDTDLGVLFNLTISSVELKIWDDANDRGGANMFFRLYDDNGQIGGDVDVWLGAATRIAGNHDFSISYTGPYNLADAFGVTLEPGKTYYLTMWAKSYGDSGDHWYNGDGDNYHTKFTWHSYSAPSEPYTRSGLTEGNFGTICLPYNATLSGAKAYKISGKVMENNALKGINLEKVEELEAGKPYIFKATDETLTATLSGEFSPAIAANGMIGNIGSSITVTPDAGYYVIGGDNLIHEVVSVSGNSNVTVGQYKAYITLAGVDVASSREANFIAFEDGGATGISQIENGELNNESYFDLQGRRVAQPTKGLYIVNGKKVIIK